MEIFIILSITLSVFGSMYCLYIYKYSKNDKLVFETRLPFQFPQLKRYLKEADFPYNLFLFYHVGVFSYISIMVLYDLAYLNFEQLYERLRMLIFLIIPLNLFIYVRVKEFRKLLLKDLFRVHEILYWQSKIKMPEDKSLAYASELISGPLKQNIIELSGSYRLKRDVVAKLEEIRNLTPVEELHAFTYMLEEKYKTGMTENFHKSSMEILKRLRRVDNKLKKLSSLQQLLFTAFILFGLFFVITGGPIILEALNQFNNMF